MTEKTINLTTRKKSLPEKVLGTFIQDRVGNEITYRVRYSQAYQPEGHLYNPSFKVLRRDYWLKHKLLTEGDIAAYETLEFLCEAAIPFSVVKLAQESGISDNTLRQRYDNLQNAELLEVITVGDGQGQPNYYILRTPLFSRDSFTGAVKQLIVGAGKPLPTVFLEDEVDRLRRNIRKNRVGKLRRLKQLKDLPDRLSAVSHLVKEHYSNRQLAIHRIFKTLGEVVRRPEGEPEVIDYRKAVEFDRIVWSITTGDMPDIAGEEYWVIFRRKLRAELERSGIKYTDWLFDMGRELSAFYDVRQRSATGNQPEKRTVEAIKRDAASLNEDEAQAREYLRKVLNELREKRNMPNNASRFKTFIENIGVAKHLVWDEIKAIAAEFYSPEFWNKLSVELRE